MSIGWGRVGAAKDTKKRPMKTGRRLERGLIVLLRFRFRESFEDERVGLVGQLGDQRQIVATEALGVVIVPRVVHVKGRFFCLSSLVPEPMTTPPLSCSSLPAPMKPPPALKTSPPALGR